VDSYNFFNGKKVADTIKEIANLWQSNYQQITFSFGRKSPPVLYLFFPYWKSETEKFENREELIKQALNLMRLCEPDELDDYENA
jgi:hypothetical protein